VASAAATKTIDAVTAEHSAVMNFPVIRSWTYLALRFVLPIG
jgi:hypothetical protein